MFLGRLLQDAIRRWALLISADLTHSFLFVRVIRATPSGHENILAKRLGLYEAKTLEKILPLGVKEKEKAVAYPPICIDLKETEAASRRGISSWEIDLEQIGIVYAYPLCHGADSNISGTLSNTRLMSTRPSTRLGHNPVPALASTQDPETDELFGFATPPSTPPATNWLAMDKSYTSHHPGRVGESNELVVGNVMADKVPNGDDKWAKIEDELPVVQGFGPSATNLYAAIETCGDETGIAQVLEQRVDTFLEGSAVLMNTLNEVGRIHPYVGVVVVAFKAILALEMTRRENNARIIALHMEITDTMNVLTKLQDIQFTERIRDRLHPLVCTTANDIKECANACDTYKKKNPIIRVLSGPVWQQRLLSFLTLFVERRAEFEFEINLLTAFGVDVANQKLNIIRKTQQEMQVQMETMMKMIQLVTSPEENAVASFVKQRGGPEACKEDDKILEELNDFAQKTGFRVTSGAPAWRKAGNKPSELAHLKEELRIDPEDAIAANRKVFSGKFEAKKQFVEELSLAMKRQGDRVISAVISGPHEKIKDHDMHKLWEVMRWRGSVKSQRFVMALRDYFYESWHSDVQPEGDSDHISGGDADSTVALTTVPSDRSSEKWALAYIHVSRLQPISEAYDDDGTGFVTVAEVNTFTTSRPLEWSLERWIAYWAIGWHQSLCDYSSKIRELFAKMFAMLPDILDANRAAAHKYIDDVYQDVTTLESAVNPCYINESLQAKFKGYVQREEERLDKMLTHVRYDIDEMDTVAVVTGPGRIEKFVLPLLYLILKRHVDIFKICRIRNTHSNELPDAVSTIKYVIQAFKARFDTLCSIFKHQRLDVRQHFEIFAHGLFKYHYEPSGLWAHALVSKRQFPEYTYNDSLEKSISVEEIGRILNHPMGRDGLDISGYHNSTQDRPAVPSSARGTILGLWNGFTYRSALATEPNAGMISMTLCPCDGNDRAFSASGRCDLSEYTISGQCTKEDDVVNIAFTREFFGRRAQYWNGHSNTAADDGTVDTITGTWGSSPDPKRHRGIFILKRIAPELLRFRPAPAIFNGGRICALWLFAITAVRYQVRQQLWPISHFLERQKIKKRFLELYKRQTRFKSSLDDRDEEEFMRIRKTLTPADSRLYCSQAEFEMERVTGYITCCDNCDHKIYGARIICLVCEAKHTWCPVDLCGAENCINASIDRDDLPAPHLPTHDMVKVRRTVHLRQFGELECSARAAVERARVAFEPKKEPGPGPEGYDSDSSSEDIEPTSKEWASKNRAKDEVRPRHKCAMCKKGVTLPCWYCVQCKEDTFICNDCDNKGPATFAGHERTHDLIRCPKPRTDDTNPIEAQLANLEQRFTKHEVAIGDRLSQLESQVERVEKLLEVLLGIRDRADLEVDGEAGRVIPVDRNFRGRR